MSSKDPDSFMLDALIAMLGPDVMRVEAAPIGLDHPVYEPVIFDANTDSEPLRRGDLLLAVNVAPDNGGQALLAEADAAGVAGVVFKRPTNNGRVELASRSTTVLSIGADLPWASCFSLLKSIIAGSQFKDDEDDDTPPRSLFSLADTIADVLGGAVSIYDPSLRLLLAYSSLGHPVDALRRDTILGRGNTKEVIAQLRADGILPALWSGDAVVHINYPGARHRMGVCIRSGDEVLGLLFVLEGENPFGAEDEAALLSAAKGAALHLLRLRALEDFDNRMRSRLLRRILVGSWPGEVAASQLDIDAEDANVVAGFYLDVDDPQMTLQRSRLHSMLLLYGRSVSHRAMATTVGRVMYLLLPLQKQARQSQVAFVIEQIVDKAQELLGLSLVVGVSSPARTVGELPRARSEADQVLDVLLTSRKGDRIATYNEVASRIFLLEVGKQLAPLLPTQPSKIALLAEHDDRHGTDLLGTLRSWLDAFGDVNLVADVMHVHPNTVRHRLRRLAEIADLDLTDPIERFVVELQLRLTAQESPPENLDS